MRAGTLRQRIDIQEEQLTQNQQTGEMEKAWVTVWERVPASFAPLSARDLLAAQAGQSEATARVVIRYRAGVLPTMRIIHRGNVCAIAGQPLPDQDSGLEYLTILVSQGVKYG
ncbi:phage head closure protein [Pseudomonas sp. B26(2017)]|uniref:phage head closure protein n=1 Tax=Pseudomonas sp. B26(2017) TaxID=1981732 RepID=UPI000A1DE3A1|nr:phage head closure protein [Pseudomonas sp. B26(2017)]